MIDIKPAFLRWVSRGSVIGVMCFALGGTAQVTPALPTVDLSIGPVAVNAQAVNIALALSVEFPTVGAAYRTATYDHATTYLGYWDPKGCYAYKDPSTGAPLNGEYFYRTATVDSTGFCNSSGAGTTYGGNVLNYVATSSIDLLRYGLTGGNRVADTNTTTVLERAYLYNGWSLNNSTYFPAHRIPAMYVGKVTPSTALNQDIYGGSCLDRIWFGSSNASANCDTPGASGNLNPAVADPTAASTVLVAAGAPAPTFSTYQATNFYITNPLQTTTVMPTAGPVTYTDTIVMGSGTSLTPVPGPTGPGFISNSYVDNGGTTTTAPISPTPTTIVGTQQAPLATRYFQSFIPSSGVYRTFNFTSSVNVCRSSGSTNPTSFIGSLDSNGVPQAVASRACGSGVYATVPSRGGIAIPPTRTVYEPQQLINVYKTYTVTPIYRDYTLTRVYDVYEAKDEYIKYGTKIGPMFARVKVCDGTEATTRSDLCARYPDGNYKPVGEIQRNADVTRVSAFGYVAEDGTARYGGALRAPMRFTGPSYRDTSGAIQTNLQSEWNANNGIFATDPLGTAPNFATSGVINYLNKFGTTGTKGYYKANDPVGELYYEALRYFQGLGPTPAAISGLTNTSYDGFPVYGSAAALPKTLAGWVDPVQNACQRRNFILTIGDVNTHADRQLPGNKAPLVSTADPARAAEPLLGDASKTLDAVYWTSLLTGFETGVSRPYTDALGVARNTLGNPNVVATNTTLESKGTGSGGSSAYYWAGAAYWANTQPIRWDTKGGQSMKDVRVKTFTIDVDEGGNGLIDGNSRGIQPRNSAAYLAGKYGWFGDANRDGNPFITSGGQINNTEWEDITAPNTPDGYVIASQAQKLLSGIRKFFSAAVSEKGAVSVSSLSSQRFTSTDPNGDLFAPRFDTRDWSGTVERSGLKLNPVTGVVDTTAGIKWDAGLILTKASLAGTAIVADPYVKPNDRNIFTMSKGVSSTSGQVFSVSNKGNLDTAVTTALNTDPATNTVDSRSDARINWLRGDRSNEQNSTGGTLRRRNRIMGDVINSGPVFKQGADSDVRGAGYTEFAQAVATRTPMIYVGANDGMMHGFRATDGKELFAYIPRAVAQNLNQLTSPAYLHRPYVDGVPAVNEAQISGTWKTVLASGLGGGAQGVFALDVTAPTSFGATNILFEFTDQDDPDMGNVVSQPKIVKMQIAGSNPVAYKWFVVVGSGYNNYKIDGTNFSLTGSQALFLLSLDKTPSEAWTLGTNYFKVMLPAPPLTSIANGLTNPGFAKGAFGEALYFYSGDLQGNLWRFNFANGLNTTTATNAVKVNSGVKVPISIAKDAANNLQPITVSPVVTSALNTGYMVTFGTGKFIEPNDASTIGPQTMYGIWDFFSTTNSDYAIGRSKLFPRSIVVGTATTTVSGSETFTFGTGASGSYRGWYADLPASGERVATEGTAGLGFVGFNSTIPDGSCSGDGTSRSMCFGSLYGQATCSFELLNIGIGGKPSIITIEDGSATDSYSSRNSTGRRLATVRQSLISTGTKITDAGNVAASTSQVTPVALPGGRMGWREVRNFKDN